MQPLNYFLTAFISYLGLLAGMLLVKIAPEEQKQLAKPFTIGRKIFLLIIFLLTFLFYYKKQFYIFVLSAYALFLLLLEFKINDLQKKSMFIHGILAVMLFISTSNSAIFTVQSILIFIHGAITASLLYNIKQKNHWKVLTSNSVFIVICYLLFLF